MAILQNTNLKGKRVLVTGSSNGIGLAIAKSYLKEGCKVILNGRNKNKLDNTVLEIGSPYAHGIVGDVTKPKDVKIMFKKMETILGGLDILICNVGSGKSVEPGKENLDEWLKAFNTNFFSATNVIETFQPFLKKSKGNIICISSICGCEVIPNAPITYSVAKAALNSYVKGISRPLAENNININAIAPGNIIFKGSVWERKLKDKPLLVKKMINKEVPVKRLGDPEEIAELAITLTKKAKNFITGSVFVVDGGQTRS
tara:strand:+ start:502 stop:1275 length:774 start_codon:yes stop_codon:yes gene_type:complete